MYPKFKPSPKNTWIDKLLTGGRLTAISFAVFYLLSLSLMLAASVRNAQDNPLPSWSTYVDMVLIFLVVVFWWVLGFRTQGRIPIGIYRPAYRVATYLTVVLIVAIWLAGARLDASTFLIGLTWRVFVLLNILPAWIVSWNSTGSVVGAGQAAPQTPLRNTSRSSPKPKKK